MFRAIKIFIFFAFVVAFFSCRKDFERPNWDVDLLTPLIKTSLTLDHLLPDSTLQTSSDTSLKLVYQTNMFDIDVDSLFRIPDTTMVETFSLALPSILNPGDFFYSTSREFNLNVNNGVELTTVYIESGFIEVEVFSDIKEKIIAEYIFPSATKNGDTLVVSELIPASTGGQPGYLVKRVDVSGYHLDLTGITKTKVNTMVVRASGMVDTNAAGPVVVAAGEKIKVNNRVIALVPAYAKGYFGNQQIHFGPETKDFNVFTKVLGGSIDIDQVDVNLEFENGVGVDAQLIINQFSTKNTANNTSALLAHPVIGNSVNINRAQETFSIPEVTYTSYNMLMNTSNSNIDQLIEIFPNQLLFDLNLNINPLGNISGNNDFVFKKHPMKANLNVEFPLSLMANNLTLVDTIDFSLPTKKEKGEIIDGTLYIYADNTFPFDANINLALYDKDSKFIQKLTVVDKVRAAVLNASLKVDQAMFSVVAIPLSEADIDNLYKTKKAVMKITFTTQPQSQFVKIYEGYAIDIKLVGDFAYNVDPN
ncbi:MAG: hypothetical protein J5I47_04940 [Vicingus serpentipes]|nr:hypothetical protein [Vicingus serpentipes]